MDLGIKGRVAAVAAASKGLGFACAEAFAREGADVAICARGEEALRDAAKALEQTGARIHSVALDLAEPGASERFIDSTVETLGSCDIVVTNIGGPPSGSFDTFDDDAFRQAFERNMLVAVRLARAAVPHMRAKGWGRIINITSIAARQPLPGLMIGNTARAGVLGFAKTLSFELAAHGITVNTVAPGPFLTDRARELSKQRAAREGISVEEALRALHATPTGRAGNPEELGALVAFLASEHAGYITGAVIGSDGGSYLGLY